MFFDISQGITFALNNGIGRTGNAIFKVIILWIFRAINKWLFCRDRDDGNEKRNCNYQKSQAGYMRIKKVFPASFIQHVISKQKHKKATSTDCTK